MINETQYAEFVLAQCEDLFNVCFQYGVSTGMSIGVIVGFVFFIAFWMTVRKDIKKEKD